MKITLCSLTVLFISLVSVGESAKILGLFPTFSKSHLIIHRAIMQTLIDRGHDVTIVSTLPLDEAKNNYRHVYLDVPPPPPGFMTGIIKKSKGPFSLFGTFFEAMGFTMDYNNASLHHPKMKKLMAEESFELVVFGSFFNNFLVGVAAHFKCPLVITFLQRPMGMIDGIVGNPAELSYVPHMMVANSQPIGFFDRVKTVLATIAMDKGFFTFFEHKTNTYYESNFPIEKYPSYRDMMKNVSLVLCNSHFSNGVIRPNVPAVIEVGGIQVKPKSDPLPVVDVKQSRCKEVSATEDVFVLTDNRKRRLRM